MRQHRQHDWPSSQLSVVHVATLQAVEDFEDRSGAARLQRWVDHHVAVEPFAILTGLVELLVELLSVLYTLIYSSSVADTQWV